MNKKLKNILLIGGIILLVALVILLISWAFRKDKEDIPENGVLNKDNYKINLKLDSDIKLDFEAKYYTCDGKVCGTMETKTTKIEITDEKMQTVFKDIEYKDKKIEDVIASLVEAYRKYVHQEGIMEYDITTNWQDYEKYELDAKTTSEVNLPRIKVSQDLK